MVEPLFVVQVMAVRFCSVTPGYSKNMAYTQDSKGRWRDERGRFIPREEVERVENSADTRELAALLVLFLALAILVAVVYFA